MRFAVVLCALVVGANCAETRFAEKGILDLSSWNPESGVIRLSGEWLAENGRLVGPKEKLENPSVALMPFADPGAGCSTLRLRILLPEGLESIGIGVNGQMTAHSLYVGDRGRSGSGVPSCASTQPDSLPSSSFYTTSKRSIDITLQISNHDTAHASAGIVTLGAEEQMRAYELARAGLELAVATALLIIGTYHTILSVLRFRMHAHAALAGICVLAFFHHVTSGLRILPLLTGLPFGLYMRMEAVPLFFLGAVHIHFVTATARIELSRRLLIALYGTSSLLALLYAALPLRLTTAVHSVPEAFAAAEVLAGTALSLLAVVRRHEGAVFVLAGSIVLAAGQIHDIFSVHSGSLHLSAACLLVFLALQTFATARQFSSAFESVENLGVKLLDTNSAYTRFMPAEFLSYMNKESILDVQLGDHIQQEMTVLFSDIRSFTALSETMSPAENFEFLNGYLSRVGPVIRGHNGFIDKYIGDGIMALFPGSADDAVRAAIDMQTAIQRYNEERRSRNRPEIHIGVGIHTGTLIMGIIGENERMEGTVISDVVNVASRIESLTREYSAAIMISGDTLVKLDDALAYKYRLLGRVPVKGKSKPVSIVEILDGRDDLEKMLETKLDFEKGLAALMLGRKDEALLWLEQVLAIHPGDGAARFYVAYLQGKGDPERPVYVPVLTDRSPVQAAR